MRDSDIDTVLVVVALVFAVLSLLNVASLISATFFLGYRFLLVKIDASPVMAMIAGAIEAMGAEK